MTTQPPAPDWYPDPTGKPGLKYWDGQGWHAGVPATAPRGEEPVESIPPAPRPQRQTAVITTLYVAVAVLVGVVAVTSYLLLKQSHRTQTPSAQPAPPSTQAPQPSTQAAPASQYFTTSSGKRCQLTAERVACENCVPGQVITNAYTCTDPAPAIAVNAAGIVDKDAGDIGSPSGTQQLSDGQTYHANGWTIVASGGWVRFINDTTGHGLAIAGQNLDTF